MIWQDIVIAVATFLFSLSLLNQIIYGFKKHKATITILTASITSLGLYTMAFAFFTLSMYYSSIMGIINGTMWAILLIQSIIYKKL